MKRLLESEEVSYTINQWIDLIYGYKQYGEEAVKAINVYPLYTYDSSTGEREEDSKQMHEEVKISQAYNFGQTPSLMFKEAHKQRKLKHKALKYNLIVDSGATIRPYRPVDNQRSVVIFYSKFIDHKKILTLTREKTIKSFNLKSKTQSTNPNSPFTIESSFEKDLPQSYVNYLDSFNLKDNTFQILDEVELLIGKGTHVVRGGLWNGAILVCNVENGKIEVIEAHSSTVTCITIDEKDKLAVSGSKKGDIAFWEIGLDKQQWTKRFHFFHHEDFVTSITIKDSLVLTSSLDCSINLYNLKGKLIRTFYHPKGNPVFTAIYSNSPLPCIVFFSYRDKVLYSYSVNGKFLSSCSEKDNDPLKCPMETTGNNKGANLKYDLIRSPKIVADSNFNDHIIYGTDKGTILIRSLPYLDQPRYSLVATGHSILTLLASADRRFLLVGTTVGGLRVLTDPRFISTNDD